MFQQWLCVSGYVGKREVAWNEFCMESCYKELQESMDTCTGLCGIAEIMLKMVLNTIEVIKTLIVTSALHSRHSTNVLFIFF